MCYNFMELAGKIVADQVLKEGEAPGGGGSGGAPQQTPPAPAPQPQPKPQDPAALLVGTWLSTQQLAMGEAQIRITYRADGSYETLLTSAQAKMRISGQWSARSEGADKLIVSFTPRKRCDASGACQQNQLIPETARLQFTDHDTITVNETATFRRER